MGSASHERRSVDDEFIARVRALASRFTASADLSISTRTKACLRSRVHLEGAYTGFTSSYLSLFVVSPRLHRVSKIERLPASKHAQLGE